MALTLTRKEFSPAYYSNWQAQGSTGLSFSVGLGGISGGFTYLKIPMINTSTKEKINVTCTGLSTGVGVGPPINVGISPSALPSSGVGKVFAMPGMQKPFLSSWFKGFALACTVTASTLGPVAEGYTVVIFSDTPSIVLDAADRTNAVLGYKAVCVLKGMEITGGNVSYTLSGMLAQVT